LTPRGKALVKQLISIVLAVESSAIANIGTRDLARIKQVLHDMYAKLNERPQPGASR